MDSITELAKILKARENPSIQGISIGKVLTEIPDIKVSLNGFILDKSRIVIAKHLIKQYETSSTSVSNHGKHMHTIEDVLKAGDKVIVIPTMDDSTYFVIDKVGDI